MTTDTELSSPTNQLISCIKAAWNAIGKTPAITYVEEYDAVYVDTFLTFEPVRYGEKRKTLKGERTIMVNGWNVWTEFPHPKSGTDEYHYQATEAYQIGIYATAQPAAKGGLMFVLEYAINNAVGLETL